MIPSKVTVENKPTIEKNVAQMGYIISALYSDFHETLADKMDFLEEAYGNRWFFYLGGNHIAVHELTEGLVPREERVLIAELN